MVEGDSFQFDRGGDFPCCSLAIIQLCTPTKSEINELIIFLFTLVSDDLVLGLAFLLTFSPEEADELPAGDESAWGLPAGGLAVVADDLLEVLAGSGRDALAFSNMGITLDLDAGWK